jgi:hypothetical protein
MHFGTISAPAWRLSLAELAGHDRVNSENHLEAIIKRVW